MTYLVHECYQDNTSRRACSAGIAPQRVGLSYWAGEGSLDLIALLPHQYPLTHIAAMHKIWQYMNKYICKKTYNY